MLRDKASFLNENLISTKGDDNDEKTGRKNRHHYRSSRWYW